MVNSCTPSSFIIIFYFQNVTPTDTEDISWAEMLYCEGCGGWIPVNQFCDHLDECSIQVTERETYRSPVSVDDFVSANSYEIQHLRFSRAKLGKYVDILFL